MAKSFVDGGVPGEDDCWHLNDVCIVGQRLYACAFGRYAHYRGYKDYLSSGDGIVFDIEFGRNVVAGLCAPHNPRYFDGAWTVCDSLRNSVVQVDADGQRKRAAATALLHTRSGGHQRLRNRRRERATSSGGHVDDRIGRDPATQRLQLRHSF